MKEKFILAKQVAEEINGVISSNYYDFKLMGLALPLDADETQLTFIGKNFPRKSIDKIKAKIIITPLFFVLPNDKIQIKTIYNIEEILDKIVNLFIKKGIYHNNEVKIPPKISETAKVAQWVKIGENTIIEEGTIIDDFVCIGRNVSIGKNCRIYSNSTIMDDTVIGDNVNISSGVRIGCDSFEYGQRDYEWVKIPNIGNVIISDNVEIGANTTIDRGTIGSTIIGEGTKIDNLVMIAHEVVIGKSCKIISQTGIAGWSRIGDNCIIYGQCGIANNVIIGDKVTVLAKSGVTKNIDDYEIVSGFPACRNIEDLRMKAYLKKQVRSKIK